MNMNFHTRSYSWQPQMGAATGATAGGASAVDAEPQSFIRIHTDSQQSLDQLFNPQSQSSVPLRNRNLPLSFFNPSLKTPGSTGESDTDTPEATNSISSLNSGPLHFRSTSYDQRAPVMAHRPGHGFHSRAHSTLAPMPSHASNEMLYQSSNSGSMYQLNGSNATSSTNLQATSIQQPTNDLPAHISQQQPVQLQPAPMQQHMTQQQMSTQIPPSNNTCQHQTQWGHNGQPTLHNHHHHHHRHSSCVHTAQPAYGPNSVQCMPQSPTQPMVTSPQPTQQSTFDNHVQGQFHTHSQSSNSIAEVQQQFQFHTIHPTQHHQPAKQQQLHQRVHSLQPHMMSSHQSNQVEPRSIHHADYGNQVQQIKQQQQYSIESRAPEFSRYADMQSIMDGGIQETSVQPSKYHEHVYYN